MSDGNNKRQHHQDRNKLRQDLPLHGEGRLEVCSTKDDTSSKEKAQACEESCPDDFMRVLHRNQACYQYQDGHRCLNPLQCKEDPHHAATLLRFLVCFTNKNLGAPEIQDPFRNRQPDD